MLPDRRETTEMKQFVGICGLSVAIGSMGACGMVKFGSGPNAPGQKPAFEGQTRVREEKLGVAFAMVTVAEGLRTPWGLAFLPDGKMLVTERPGSLRVVTSSGKLSEPVAGLPKVDARGQGGLLGIALDPDFTANRYV